MPDKTTVAGELPVVAYGFPNTAITGSQPLMLLEHRIPKDDQYGGAMWLPLVLHSDATAALAQKDGEIAALREALQRTTHIIDRMGDMPDEFISPGVWRDLKCERAIELARAALGSQA